MYLPAVGSAAETQSSAEVFRKTLKGLAAMPRKPRTPMYRLHKQSGQAIVTLPDNIGGRRDVLLGTYDSPESHELYGRIIAERKAGTKTANGYSLPNITINELIVGFWKFAEDYFGSGK